MTKGVYRLLASKKGLTLIEVIVSLAILAIIVVPFLGMFTQSTRANRMSENMLDATYVAKSCMEEIYNISTKYSFSNAGSTFQDNDYIETVVAENNDYDYSKYINGYYAIIQVRRSFYEGNLIKVVTRVYNNSGLEKLEAQMETILLWDN